MIADKNTNPRRTWVVGLLFAIVALLGGLRVYATLDMRESLQAVSATINIPYMVISGAITFLGGLLGVGVIFLRQIWVPKAVLIAATVLSLLYWFDQFCFVENTTNISSTWRFSLLVNVLILGLLGWVLTRKRVQAYYQRAAQV